MRARLACLALVMVAGQTVHAEEHRRWMFSAESGAAAMHQASFDGALFGIRLHRLLGSGLVRVDAAGMFGTADEGFGVLEAGLELRLCSAPCKAGAYIGGGAGRLSEPEFGGWAFRVNGGLELRVSERNVLRIGGQGGTHGGRSGPHLITIAFGHRFGGSE